MRETSLETAELFATVEDLRAKEYPDLDGGLVTAILEVEHRYSEDRAEARKRTEQIINRWVTDKSQGGDA